MSFIRLRQFIFRETISDFFFVFFFIILLWVCNLLLYLYLHKSPLKHLTFLIVTIITGIIAYAGMLFLVQYLTILNEVPHYKSVGVGFRGIVANLVVITFLYSTTIFSKFKEIESENERLKRNQLESQLSQLKAQLNPHFLFNSLNTLKAMVEDKDENSVEYLIKLSEVYRYFLDNSESHLVTVHAELKIAQAYFFMLKNRFEDNISLKITLSPKASEQKIPAMSLQLLIENAVKHNVISRSKPLEICIYDSVDQLIVKNNFQPKRSVEQSTKIGLQNLNNRSKLLSHKEIKVNKTDTSFIVTIPFA
ncbi:MAG: histidine kinase [Spirosomataceae bacterium]